MGKISDLGEKIIEKLKPKDIVPITEKKSSNENLKEVVQNTPKIEDATEGKSDTSSSETVKKSMLNDRKLEKFSTKADEKFDIGNYGYFYSNNFKEEPLRFLGDKKTIYKYKKTENIQMVIFLIEDTQEVALINDSIVKIAEVSMADSDDVYVIHYSDNVKVEKSEYHFRNDFKCSDNVGNTCNLLDALSEVNNLIKLNLYNVTEYEEVKKKINTVLIIGIGRCLLSLSNEQQEKILHDFNINLSKEAVTSKYFCLNDNFVINAANVGFHSIGCISKLF